MCRGLEHALERASISIGLSAGDIKELKEALDEDEAEFVTSLAGGSAALPRRLQNGSLTGWPLDLIVKLVRSFSAYSPNTDR